MLLICLKSVPRYKFLILDTYQPDCLRLRGKDVRISGYFSKQEGSATKTLRETLTWTVVS